ncbi:DinB family protein [Flavivirga spongiicola]|uniref:DinB family protein n=1 Tax=Flavivirga spongiicola TaxID=421621 RepID=A0ABU7XSD0_9FLAO|nr:DinB family protein [Flavivirga sp. MEBiC05379]MDO5978650.1 DinB family protein [Flavivirga sp. MEBiC05379]
MTFTFEVLTNTRNSLKNILEKTSLEDLNKIPEGFNNNIIWNVAHIIVSEQLLVYKLSGLPMMLSSETIDKYRKDSKPEAFVTQKEVNEIKELLFSTIEKTEADYKNKTFKEYNTYTVSTTGNTLTNVDEALQFVFFHEGLHIGYILALLKAIKM